MKAFEKILKALANHRRLQIIKFIKDKKQATVGTIAAQLKLSFRSTSRHLAILYSAGIVEREQEGLSVFYSLADSLPKISKQVIDFI